MRERDDEYRNDEEHDGTDDVWELSLTSNCSFYLHRKGLKTEGI